MNRGPGAFVALAMIGAAACGGPAAPAGALAPAMPDQVIRDFVMDTYQGSERSWSLRSPRADIYDDDHRVELSAPRLRFYEKNRPSSSVTAARGRLDTATRDLWAGGGVVLVSTEGARLESEWMRFDSLADRLVSTAPVVITRGRSRVRGIGWEATRDLSTIEIRRQRGEIAGEDAKRMRPR
ncbi:MAG TPA: LPS export ABC transporter periplasmic protein LptC [Elusimicrobiota bacterium]|nr:LPS export ABC transporter periplasmic protein LptC [Elusimicrobiota bacterium]HMZ27008.1 LPS export ABC transporter periplasmic protein LptC [Elusimicrobiota bacterium]HNA60208.1 LPS export ABC transporter periplasmic protein LptC [Elusimicrobiota bacterium]HND65009.1 LPS export ABC transporter periplasmic protein LptC [Elusimicrobiota bacterium]HNF58447.1 LPS export ABC transporter periplasmic protein LptC [Elusimicrobiota bacterium]